MRWRFPTFGPGSRAGAPASPSPDPAPGPSAGQRRRVTVLFADLEGFTALTEQLPAEEVVEFLNAHFTAMGEVVARWGGALDKFIGDAMLVVWDDREHSPEDGAEAAVRAALEMHRVFAETQQSSLHRGRRPVKIRIGISSGVAIAGEIGSPRRREVTVIGDVVNTASRLEALNKELLTDTIISGATHALVGGRCIARPLGLVPLKGRREPLEAFALLGWPDAEGPDLG